MWTATHRKLARSLANLCALALPDVELSRRVQADAAWGWRFSFYFHWGEHATSALRALYWLIQKTADDI